MSLAEIIEELPKLSAEQRSSVAKKLRELEDEDGMLFLHEAAQEMFQEMDAKEEKNASRKPG